MDKNVQFLENTYVLIQLKKSDPDLVFSTCKEVVKIPGVVAAASISGIFDIIAKVYATEEETEKILAEIRSWEKTDFATNFSVSQVYLSTLGLKKEEIPLSENSL